VPLRQSASNGATASSNTIAQALGSAVLAGSRLKAFPVWGATTGTVTQVSDSINGTANWVKVTGSNASEAGGPTQGEFWTNPNSAAGPAPTITVTFSVAQTFRALAVEEITGTDPTEGAAALASASAKGAATTSFVSSNITPAVNGSYISGGCSNDLDATVPAAGGAFTLREVTTGQVTGTEDQVQAVAAAIAANFTFPSAVTGTVHVVAFKPAPVVVPAPLPRRCARPRRPERQSRHGHANAAYARCSAGSDQHGTGFTIALDGAIAPAATIQNLTTCDEDGECSRRRAHSRS
jgi:hypothetical protein